MVLRMLRVDLHQHFHCWQEDDCSSYVSIMNFLFQLPPISFLKKTYSNTTSNTVIPVVISAPTNLISPFQVEVSEFSTDVQPSSEHHPLDGETNTEVFQQFPPALPFHLRSNQVATSDSDGSRVLITHLLTLSKLNVQLN